MRGHLAETSLPSQLACTFTDLNFWAGSGAGAPRQHLSHPCIRTLSDARVLLVSWMKVCGLRQEAPLQPVVFDPKFYVRQADLVLQLPLTEWFGRCSASLGCRCTPSFHKIEANSGYKLNQDFNLWLPRCSSDTHFLIWVAHIYGGD